MSSPTKAPDDESRSSPQSSSKTPPVIDEDAARDLVSSLFFGVMAPLVPPRATTDESNKTDNPTTKSSPTKATEKSRKSKDDNMPSKVLTALKIDQHIPKDASELSKIPLFKSTYELLQWQRDNYLVSKDYADWRKSERRQERQRGIQIARDSALEIAKDPTAMGHRQLDNLASSFIPSQAVRSAALPLVVGIPRGSLYNPSREGLINLIHGQQDNLNRFVKNALTNYLQNPQNRVSIKSSTQGYIATQYKDGISLKNPKILRGKDD